jgi:RNA polymerase sigma factor (sigma-70 family)
MTDATQLLRDYADHGSEPAFRELVRRYTDLVYSVALRRASGDRHLAEDIVQKVFTDLAIQSRRGRGPLAGGPCALGGWLHRHTCFVAANLHRADQRRQVREQLAVEMDSLDSAPDASWQQLAPVLDETLHELEPHDRDALLLRFYERRDLRAIGVALGVSEDAAQKRVARALDKLRGLLAARGVALGAAGLASLLTEGTVQAAPSALAGRASEAACAAAAVGVGSGLLGWLLATTQAKLAAGLVVAGLIALPLWWHADSRNSSGDGTAGEVGSSAPLAAPVGESGAQHEAALASAWTVAGPAESEMDPEALKLTFLTADTGRPVPNVAVDYWCRHGESVDRRTLHGTRLGVCEVRFPRHTATELRLTSQCEGFARYAARMATGPR